MIDCPLRFTAKGAFPLVRAPHDVRGDVRRAGALDDRYRRLIPMSLRGQELKYDSTGGCLFKTGCCRSAFIAGRHLVFKADRGDEVQTPPRHPWTTVRNPVNAPCGNSSSPMEAP